VYIVARALPEAIFEVSCYADGMGSTRDLKGCRAAPGGDGSQWGWYSPHCEERLSDEATFDAAGSAPRV